MSRNWENFYVRSGNAPLKGNKINGSNKLSREQRLKLLSSFSLVKYWKTKNLKTKKIKKNKREAK